ncbi:MAG: uroporphyrinogen-III synthase [Rickettsiales bacterium]
MLDNNKNKTILITRPKGDESLLKDELTRRNYKIIHEPLTEIILKHDSRMEVEHFLFKDPNAVLITSSHGAKSLSLLTDIRDMFLLCVGDNTANTAKQLGFSNVTATGENVDHMIDYVMDCYDENSEFLYISGEHTSADLENIFSVRGMSVKRIITYEAVAVDEISDTTKEQLKRGNINVVTFFSKRAAEIFLTLIEKNELSAILRETDAFCLSENIAGIIERYKWKTVNISKQATLKSLLDSIDESYNKL